MGSEARRTINEWIQARPATFKLKEFDELQFIVTISLCMIYPLKATMKKNKII